MASKRKREDDWARAKRLCRLNVETVRMAKELGLNPRKLTKSIPSKSQPWKAPVHVWIRDLYEKMQAKAARRRAAKQLAQDEYPNEPGDPAPAQSRPTGLPPAPPGRPCSGQEASERPEAMMPPNDNAAEPEDEEDPIPF